MRNSYLKKGKSLKTGLFMFLMLVISSNIGAQVAGTTQSVSSTLSFSKAFNDVDLDPTPNVGSASRVQFVKKFTGTAAPSVTGAGAIAGIMGAEGVNVPDWLFDLTGGLSFFCSGLEPVFNASASIDAGGYYETHSIGKSKLAFHYPVKVDVIFPEKNTFGCGDKVTIRTLYTLLPHANKLLVDAPFVNQEIGPILQNLSFNLNVGIKAYVGYGVSTPYPCGTLSDPFKICYYEICGDKKYFDYTLPLSFGTNLPSLPPLVNVCANAFGSGANEASLLSCNWSSVTPLLKLGQWTLDSYNRQHNTNYTFATFPDENTVVIAPPDLPSAADISIPEMEGKFKNVKNTELDYSTSNSGRNLLASGSKSSISELSLDLVSLLDYTGVPTSYSIGGGRGQADIGDISPTFTVDQHMNFNFIPEIFLNIDLGLEMQYEVFDANGTFSHNGFGRMVHLVAGQYIEAMFPQAVSMPVTVSGSTEVKGNLTSVMNQDYFRSIRLKVGEIQIPGLTNLTLIDETLQKEKIGSKTILEHTREYSLGTENLAPFLLDPENPVVEIDYVRVDDEKSLGNGEKAVVYSVGISNGGDVKLSNLQLNFNLGETYAGATSFSVECLNSSTLNLNTSYNGTGDIHLLGAGNMLGVGESGRVEILVRVKPALAKINAQGCFVPVVYNAKAKASGVSPIGTYVENNFNQCTNAVTGPDRIATVDLGAEIISSIEDFTLYGTKLVKIDKPESYGLGNIGSGGDMVFENSSLHGADQSVIIGDIHIAGELFLQGESKLEAGYIQLAGKLKNPNWKSRLMLNGVLSENSGCVARQTIQITPFTPGKSAKDVTVKSGKTETLLPGEYNAVVLSENSELKLLPGTYRFGRWAFLGNHITVKFQTNGEPIQLNINVWQASGAENTKLVIEGNGKPENVVFNYQGNQKCTFKSSLVQGKIIAPNAEIEFANQSVLEGKCFAGIINFKTGSVFRGLTYLEPINIASDCRDILIPGELPDLKSGEISATAPGADMQIDPANEIVVYPNPTNDKITIRGLHNFIGKELKIFNVAGQVIEKRIINNSEIQIDLVEYPSGVYYIELNQQKTTKVVRL